MARKSENPIIMQLCLLAGMCCAAAAHGGAPAVQLRGGAINFKAKLVSTWAGDLGDLAAASAIGGVAGVLVGSSVKSTINLVEVLYTQAAISLFLRRLGLIRIEWGRVRTLAFSIARVPLRIVQSLLSRHAAEKMRHKAAELERVRREGFGGLNGDPTLDPSKDSSGPRSTSSDWQLLNEHAAIGGVCSFAAGVALAPAAGIDWRRLRGGYFSGSISGGISGGCTCSGRFRFMQVSADGLRFPRAALSRVSPRVLLVEGEETRDAAADAGKRSIGDVVKGVHGGKYQFKAGGFEAFAGEEFASALYASTPSAGGVGGKEEGGPWPEWASQLRRPRGGSVGDVAAEEVQLVRVGDDGMATVRVTNVYRSWEKFYVTLYAEAEAEAGSEANDCQGAPFLVAPLSGDLAPRGGASNVCDENQPYLDHADVTIRALRAGEATMLVRTEEEQWVFRLVASVASPPR